jgi:hypothetical protein
MLNATSALWADDSLNFLLTSFAQTYSKNMIFTQDSGGMNEKRMRNEWMREERMEGERDKEEMIGKGEE